MRLKYRKGLVMMLTNTFKENVVNHIRLTGLTDHDITFHRENGDCFLVIVSDDTMTTIVRVTELKKEIVCSIVAVSLHSNGVPDSGLEILTAIADAIVKETGKYVRVKKA
jgi:hypothetical protein